MFAFRRFLLWSVAAALTIATLTLIACGGGDGIQTGNDEDYVLAACNAQNEFFEAAFSAALGGTDATEEEQLKALEEPFKDLRKATADSRPPEDAVEYQREFLAIIDALIEGIEDGDVSVMDSDDNPDDKMSAETRDRLGVIAAGIAECEDLGNPFDSND